MSPKDDEGAPDAPALALLSSIDPANADTIYVGGDRQPTFHRPDVAGSTNRW